MDAERTRRLSDVSELVRRWVAEGAVDPNAATRFLLARADDG